MGQSWNSYTAIYYSVHVVLYPFIYTILIMSMPFDLINWILNTIFSWEDDVEKERAIEIDEITITIVDTKLKPKVQDHIDGCICNDIWKYFEEKLQKICSACCLNSICSQNCSKQYLHRCCICIYRLREDLENKKISDGQVVKLKKNENELRPGLIYLHTKRIAVYLLLCTTIWCASVAFFEGVILGYAIVGTGDSCPIPKRAASTIVMDCFIYEHSFDSSPKNKTFPTHCNLTVPVPVDGNWAGCFGWIYTNIEVVDVIDALGVCTGIVAFIGSAVVLISFLCRSHGWRFCFDILACVAFGTIWILIWKKGNVPFLTYTLLIALVHIITTIEYLVNRVPIFTGVCLARCCYKYIKTRITVAPSTN